MRHRPSPISFDHFPRLLGFVIMAAWGLTACTSDPLPEPRPLALRQAEEAEAAARRHGEQQRWLAAEQRWLEAVDRYALLNDRAREATAWHNAAIAQKHQAHFEQALESLHRAIALNESLAQRTEWWRNHIALIQIRSKLEPPEALTELFSGLRPNMAGIQDDPTRGLLYNELGLWEWRQDHLNAALESLTQAEQALAKANHPSGQARVQANQALVLETQGNLAEATRRWQQARQKFEALADPYGIATTMAGEGRTLLTQGINPDYARDLLLQAARNFEILDLEEERIRVEQLLHSPPEGSE